MSIRADLSKLSKLIERFHKGLFNMDDYDKFATLMDSLRSDVQSDLYTIAADRRTCLSLLNNSIKLLAKYAEAHQMPEYTDYFGKDKYKIFRLRILAYGLAHKHDAVNGIFLVSKSDFFGKDIKPGVYHWQHPPSWGYDETDVICELTPENVEKLGLSNKDIDQLIQKSDEILKNDNLIPATEREENKLTEYKDRWPDAENFIRHNLKFKDVEELEKIDPDEVSRKFNVKINIDFEDCTLEVFGPSNNVSEFYKIIEDVADINDSTFGDLKSMPLW